jgi:hypothetical protein
MYLFLTQYTSPRSIPVAAFHRVGAGSWACITPFIRFLWWQIQLPTMIAIWNHLHDYNHPSNWHFD